MHVTMIGSGYVGLVSGACFADFGHSVTCVDVDASRIAALQRGELPIYEPNLDELVARNVREGRLEFTTDLAASVAAADAVFISVGTPSHRGNGHADLTHVHAAAREIAAALEGFTVVVMKSTVPVGAGDEVERILREARPDGDFAVVSNPEFLREGAAIEDFKRPDRIVVGTEDERARQVMAELYRPLNLNQAPILVTGRRTAEMIKYAANAFLAVKITFINEIADLCERTGANVQEVARGMGLDHRIGPQFLHAGPGFGGSCFPKDTRALAETAREHGSPLRIVEAVIAVNEERKPAMAGKIVAACGGSVKGRTIALLGLTFKPNTDDMRESPAIDIVRALQDAGASIRAHDPKGRRQAERILSDIAYCADPYACAQGADALVIVTEWDSFRALDFARLKRRMKAPVLVDLRNVYKPYEVTRYGFTYMGVGIGDVEADENRPAKRRVPRKAPALRVNGSKASAPNGSGRGQGA